MRLGDRGPRTAALARASTPPDMLCDFGQIALTPKASLGQRWWKQSTRGAQHLVNTP